MRSDQGLDPNAGRWVGWHSFELTGQPGTVITISLRAGRERIEIIANARLLAVLDRDEFRNWLSYPAPGPLEKDEVEWSVYGGTTFLTLGYDAEHGTYATPAETVAYLTGVI